LGGSAGVSPAAFGVLAECRDVRNGTLRPATGTVALPIPIVAADVSPLIIPVREKFEPTHVGCYGIPNFAWATCRAEIR